MLKEMYIHILSAFFMQVIAYISNFWQNVLILDDFEPEPGICIYVTYYCTIINMVLFTKQNLQNKEVTLSHSGCHTNKKINFISSYDVLCHIQSCKLSLPPHFQTWLKFSMLLWSHWFLDKQRWGFKNHTDSLQPLRTRMTEPNIKYICCLNICPFVQQILKIFLVWKQKN